MKIAYVYNLKKTDNVEEAEFDTPEVVDSIAAALLQKNNEVVKVEMTRDGAWVDALVKSKPDLVFNTAEGFVGMGREALAPTVFEQLKLPYVGSGPFSCFVTLDKFLSKSLVKAKGVPVAEGYFLATEEDIQMVASEVEYPVFVKPNFEGSSKGITQDSKCDNKKAFLKYSKSCLKDFPQGIIVEKYIPGKDVTIPFIAELGPDGGVLDPIEYTGTTRNGVAIYDFEMKNGEDDIVDVLCPADIDERSAKAIKRYMLKCVQALNIVDMARADFRVTPSGEVFFVEVNALPSLQQGAGIFAATQRLKLDYDQTFGKILETSVKRQSLGRRLTSRQIRKRNPNVALVYNVKRKQPGDEGYEVEAEFDSPETVDAIYGAIVANGYECEKIEATRNLAAELEKKSIDVVFNIAEGMNKASREAQVPALCDLLNIEHTGADASCLCLTLNKSLASRVVESSNVLVPHSVVVSASAKSFSHSLNYPLIVKPNQEGSSKGIYNDSVVQNEKELKAFIKKRFSSFKGPLLLEEYIVGREFTVGLLGNNSPRVVGISEILFKQKPKFSVYSYELKQVKDPLKNSHFEISSPPKMSELLKKKIVRAAREVFKKTGCRDVARVDFRVTKDDEVFFIEVNPLPGLSPGYSDLPIISEKNKMPYATLIAGILRPAVIRWRKSLS